MQPNELETLEAKYIELEEEISRLEGEQDILSNRIKEIKLENSWPQYSKKYFFIDSDGRIETSTWFDTPYDTDRQNFLGIFRTQTDAERKRDIIKALCPINIADTTPNDP